jgi:ammonium transporter, Amt family
MFGAIATGIFATAAIQEGYTGLIDGNPGQIGVQLVAIAATAGYAIVGTFIIVKVVDLILGIRVPTSAEEAGLDIAVHGEAAYQP